MGLGFDMAELLGEQREDMTDKQVRILEAAVTLFAQKGYAASSTREIAALAEVAEGTVFKHYGTKDELYLTAANLAIDHLLQPLITMGLQELAVTRFGSLEEALRALLANRLMVLERIPLEAVKLVVQELPYRPNLQERLADLLRQAPLAEMVERLQAQGLVVQWPVHMVSKLLISALLGFMLPRFMLLPQYFAGDLAEDMDYWVLFVTKALSPEGGGK